MAQMNPPAKQKQTDRPKEEVGGWPGWKGKGWVGLGVWG